MFWLIAASLLILAVFFIRYLDTASYVKIDNKNLSAANDKVYMYLSNIRQTAFADGKKQWTLKGADARLKKKEDSLLFIEKPLAIFFAAADKKIHIRGNKAILDIKTGRLETLGDVSAVYDKGVLFETERLVYNDKKIFSESRTKVSSSDSILSADSFLYDLSKDALEFNGNIKGFLSEIPNL